MLELYNAVSKGVIARINENWIKSRDRQTQAKRAFYLSAEFLIGRAIYNNLYCTNLMQETTDYLNKHKIDISIFEDIEDAALGNGGLGRLAACFLDSAATHDIPLDGYGIRYQFGLFKQYFENGFQKETADNWQKYGDPFGIRKQEDTVTVKFADQTVLAVPYDIPIIGYGGENINTLRLWQSEAINYFDFNAFNRQDYDKVYKEKNKAELICAVLYPNDETDEGKTLRIKQQYFFTSASLQDIIRNHKKTHDHFDNFAEEYAIQLNDTHPVVAIPELVRILVTEEGLCFDKALDIAKNTFAYTNHTVMPEALEKWNAHLFQSILPAVYEFIERINAKERDELSAIGIRQNDFHQYAIIEDDTIHMARLAERFNNKTNGITQRRWLGINNKELSGFIEQRIGKGFLYNLMDLKKLEQYQADENCLKELYAIKQMKKGQLSSYIEKKEGIRLNPEFIFDVQIKRLHEYKRQLLNAFSIMYIYYGLKEGSIKDFNPTAFIFGGKAAPGYYRAKGIIKYINEIAKLIDGDPEVNDKLAVVFVANYNVSYAEKIVAAANISEQISTAGTEASGTGNMKFMLNGAVTLGTYDGANVEIVEKAGSENNYIFGYKVADIEKIKDTYDPAEIYNGNPTIKRVIDSLVNGTFNDNGTHMFEELYYSLFKKTCYHDPDNYFLLGDFIPYCESKLQANKDYSDRNLFTRKCFANIINAGEFSSDRTIKQYADEIWHIQPEQR